MTDEPARPLLRVVRGNPDDTELAALVAVLSTLATAQPPPPALPSEWTRRGESLRRPLAAGPGAWRRSGLPR